MAKFLGIVDIGKTLQKQMGRKAPSIVFTSITAGSPTSNNLDGADSPTATTYAGNGIVEDYAVGYINGITVLNGDRKVLVFADSLPSGAPVPRPGDMVTAEGVAYQIVRVVRDPAAATYEIQVRK